MAANVARIHPFTIIRRERYLPISGKVTVRKGQQVAASDVIAEAYLSPQYVLLDIAKGLGVTSKKADQYLQCKVGMQVVAGDILAGPVGFAKRVLRAPKDGKIIVASGGQIFIEVHSTPFELKAGLPGNVMELVDDRGVIIETTGALVQGVWGNGLVDFGLLSISASNPDEHLSPHKLTVGMKGSVVLAGICNDMEALKSAIDLPLRGLIVGGLHPSIIREAENAPFPILVIDGIGNIPMNPVAFKLLASNEKREVNINAESWDKHTGNRPEVVIPLPAGENMPNPRQTVDFSPGQQVKIVRAPYTGKVGKLMNICTGMTSFSSGVTGIAGEVQLEGGDRAILPLVNLEVLE
ncbi:MAG: hypothetical protein JW908_04160 [Anaerolineales bacterium]|nr:hypothetical protein [Anaerolineales bacterium]